MRFEEILSEHFKTADATPDPSSLIEGLRDFGYSLETAISDIVDNSITAGATEIHISLDAANKNPWISVSDDGVGMDKGELIAAMRLGSSNPNDKRAKDDLGRFGLGMKSASFSQCRKLTVYSRKGGISKSACWDLDGIAELKDWKVFLDVGLDHPAIKTFEFKHGTVVLWENLDRVDGWSSEDLAVRSELFNAAFSRLSDHLRLVFHRFLERGLSIFVNGRGLDPIDPFASDNLATQFDPIDTLKLKSGNVKIQSVTLPHHSKMSKDEWNELGGLEGHLKSQGLYIYRSNRLIIWGTWLGIIRQTELTKLSRVRVDIPNNMDSEWKIDVKKASAKLPSSVRSRLKRVIERLVGTSKKTYKQRGRKLVAQDQYPVWNRLREDGKIMFRPNLEHPVFKTFAKQLSDEVLQQNFFNCIKAMGAGLPIATLYADLMSDAESIEQEVLDEGALKQIVRAHIDELTALGVPATNIMHILHDQELFKKNRTLTDEIALAMLGDSDV